MALAGLLVLVAGLCLGPVEESDLFFRLAAGEQFLRTGHVLHRNLFSFTFPDAAYLDPAWLFDVAAAGLFRVGGFVGIALAKTAVVLLVAFAAYRLCRRRGASDVATALVLGPGFWCVRERLVERPHIFSLLGEVAVLRLIADVDRRRVWLVIPIVALWANLHAGAFLGPLLVFSASVGAFLDGERPRGRRLLVAASISTAALLATPVGVGIVRYLSFHVGIFDLHPVDEFRALTWRSDAPFVLFATGALLVLAIPRRTAWQERFPALGLVSLALWHVRFSADAMVVLAIAALPALSAILDRLAKARLARALLVVAFFAAAFAPRIAESSRGGRFLALGLDASTLPLDAIRFVEEHGLRERMYNDFETGAYLLWQGYPRYRVFVDPRLPAYPAAFHRLLGRTDFHTEFGREEWTRAMAGLDVESALLDYAGINRRVAFWDPETWALVFRAKDSRVFVRRLSKWKDLIARFEIPATFDFSVENGAVTLPLRNPPATSPVPTCEWQLRLGDLLFDLDSGKSDRALGAYRAALAADSGCLARQRELSLTSWIGSLDVAAGRFAQALPLLDRALAVTPDDTAVLTNRALAFEGLGRSSEAHEVWARLAVLAAGTELGKRAAERAGAGH
jgi:tetratricopeptide (TPR) repeat protein